MKKFFIKKKILVINHSPIFGGATQSLLIYLKENLNFFNFTCLTPKGSSSRIFKENNINTKTVFGFSQFNNNNFGYYKGWRWFVLLREIIFFIYNIFYILKYRFTQSKPDLILLNDLTLLPSAIIFRLFYKCKIISYVRSKQNTKNFFRIKIQNFLIKKYIYKLIFIDEDVKKSTTYPMKVKIVKLYNSFYIQNKFYKNFKNKINIGFVGNFTNSKGIELLINTISKLRLKKGIFFYIVGPIPQKPNLIERVLKLFGIRENYYDLLKDNEKLISKNARFVGFRYKLDNFYKKIHLLIFPSYVSAAGRPVLEAACYGVPSLLTLFNKDNNDIIKNNFNGLYVKNNSTKDLINKIISLRKNKNLLKKLSLNAYQNSKRKFDIKKNKNIFKKIIIESI